MIPISVDELTEFLYSVLMRKSTNGDSMPEARRIARLMLAAEQMYEALNEIRAETARGSLPLTQWIQTRSTESLAAAEGRK